MQDNFDNLGEECLDSVKTYTQMEAKNAVLNPVIATACHGYIDRYCSDEVLHKVSKLYYDFNLLTCLLSLLNDQYIFFQILEAYNIQVL